MILGLEIIYGLLINFEFFQYCDKEKRVLSQYLKIIHFFALKLFCVLGALFPTIIVLFVFFIEKHIIFFLLMSLFIRLS